MAGSALLHTQSDERLVDLARAGNDRAFEAIVSRYRRPLLRYCRRLLPPERAEDAVQQTFLNAYRAIGSGEAELNLRPWLYRIAHNASLSLLRQNGWSHEELDEQFDGVQQPPQAVEQSEAIRDVVRAVQGLPERQRNAVVLRELEGRSYEEIASALGVSGGAVRQLLNRARTNLRAAATAVTPFELASWLAARGPSALPAGERIAELSAGGAMGLGGLAGAAKLGTALVVAGAVASGTTGAGPVPALIGGGDEPATEQAVAAEGGATGSGGAGRGDAGSVVRGDDHSGSSRRRAGDERSGGDDDRAGDDGGVRDGFVKEDDHSGRGSGGGGDDRSGSDGGGSSGSGSSGSGSGSDDNGSSGSGSGSSGSSSDDNGSSGSGSGSSGSGSSGSGSGSGSGSSGSGSSGSGSGSGSGSSGSGSGFADGSSGSGSGSSGSGSSSTGSSGSGSGRLDD